MTIAQMHKKVTVVIAVTDADDEGVVCTVYQSGTINGTRYWFEKRIDGQVVHRRSTLRPSTMEAWLRDIDEGCNEGAIYTTWVSPTARRYIEGRA